ncbi:glycosyl transferase family 2 [Bacillus sp. M6-12]|uniref:glycosyltransferase family 2 protein n=1 Tax=Bacillus sp. M6-12 TaxID=2054166 RepID=UPI000C78721F|nr:glycosyltransferase family 2 protein [Bacillus sp. M6-12]PLS18658.1 glycosyl transferase family 2 [Bacillus sp. M6-12]
MDRIRHYWIASRNYIFFISFIVAVILLCVYLQEDFYKPAFLTVQIGLLFFWGYWFFISMFGFGKPKEQPSHDPKKRFLILIPAHNEEAVIGSLVQNLQQQDYPKELFDITVIADNSNDGTAAISRKLGANVIEHTSLPGEKKGKPYGIKYALEYIGERLSRDYDAIAFFDADNLVSTNYLKEMNNHLMNGDRLIQCYLDSKNPDDNWVTLSYATSYYYMNRSWQLAKSKLNLGNAIGGTGFCVDTQLMEEIGWTARSLTEDLEFTMQCLLKEVPAKWSHKARVYDEKPESFMVSCVQRLRWARGHWDVCFKYGLPLLWKSIKNLDIRAFDGFMYLVNPGKIVLGTITGIILVTCYLTDADWAESILPIWIWAAFFLFNLWYIGFTIGKDAKKKFGKVKAIISLFIMNYSYVPLFIWAFITSENKTWIRTDHKRNVAFDEVAVNLDEK